MHNTQIAINHHVCRKYYINKSNNMKQKILFLSLLLGTSSLSFSQTKKDIVDYVNPLVGTDSNFEL